MLARLRGGARARTPANARVGGVGAFLAERVDAAGRAGIDRDRLCVDPGIGFGKSFEHNLELLRNLGQFANLGCAVVIGTSRKSFLGKLTGREVGGRVPATIATNVMAYERGASVFRVHDVAAVHDALAVAAATVGARWRTPTTSTS